MTPPSLPAGETDAWTLAVIAGLTAVTVLSRCFFLLSRRDLRLPRWAGRGLQYAPGAALAAVIAPEILAVQGQFLGAGWEANWSDASDRPIQSRIALNETSPTSVSATSAAPLAKPMAPPLPSPVMV